MEKAYDIHKMKIDGESGDVSGETIALWKVSFLEAIQP